MYIHMFNLVMRFFMSFSMDVFQHRCQRAHGAQHKVWKYKQEKHITKPCNSKTFLSEGSRTTPHEDNSPPDKNKFQPLPTRTTIPRTIPHQDNSPLGPLPRNKTTHQDQNLYGGELSSWGVVRIRLSESSLWYFQSKPKALLFVMHRLLESLDMWRCRPLSYIGLGSLAGGCHNLLELDLGWWWADFNFLIFVGYYSKANGWYFRKMDLAKPSSTFSLVLSTNDQHIQSVINDIVLRQNGQARLHSFCTLTMNFEDYFFLFFY